MNKFRFSAFSQASLLLILAAGLAAFSALQGMNHDQQFVYQAGLRVATGQILYDDFSFPQGPLSALLLALFFRILPTGGMAMVFSSVTLNTVATFVVWKMVRSASGALAPAGFAGLITAVWFLPVFGGYYCDHLSYLFLLLGFLFWLDGKKIWTWCLSGFCFALSYHAKQSVGGMGMVTFAIANLIVSRKSLFLGVRAAGLWIGYFATHFAVLGGLYIWGANLHQYFQSTVLFPLEWASHGKVFSPFDPLFRIVVQPLLLPWRIDPVGMVREWGWGRLAYYPVVLAVYAAFFLLVKRWRERKSAEYLALLFLILSSIWAGSLDGRLYAHQFFGMGAGIVLLLNIAWPKGRVLIYGSLGFFLLGVLHLFMVRGLVFYPEPYLLNTDLFPIKIPSNKKASWNAELVRFLSARPGSIAVLGDSISIASSGLGRAPVQPCLYYEDVLFIPHQKTRRDQWQVDFIGALSSKRTKYILYDDSDRIIRSLGIIREHLHLHYHPIYSVGRFQVWEPAVSLK